MTKRDVLAEDDAAAAGAEERRIKPFAKDEAERAGDGLRYERDELVFDQCGKSGLADDQTRVLVASGLSRAEEFFLRLRNVLGLRRFC